MGKVKVLQGQTSMFDICNVSYEKVKTREKAIKSVSDFDVIMNLYKDTCRLITRTCLGNIVVYLDDVVKFFNNNFELTGEYKNFDILPNEEILVANVESEINNIQKARLKELDPEKYILRKGDNNIYIQKENGVIYITPEGKVWDTKYKLQVNEFCEIIENKKFLDRSIVVGNKVKATYGGKEIIGKVSRIYNGGDTLNVIWEDKSTAFYLGCLQKVS